ncbi:MAG: hypothetical protein IJB09_02765 [Oscillospiraceae bacterium]|nr:hypothetical protein [Oscillospiraceae bacterium]
MKETKERTEHKETIEIDGNIVNICYGTESRPELIKAMRDMLTGQFNAGKTE